MESRKTMSANATNTEKTETSAKTVLGNFGNGRYSPVMGELYKDCQRLLGFSKQQAHVTAARLGIDLGRMSSVQAKVSIGQKLSKDGYRTVKEVASLKMPDSWAMSAAVICNGLDELRKQGLVCTENSAHDMLLKPINEAALRIADAAEASDK